MPFELVRQSPDCQKADVVVEFRFVKDLGIDALSLPKSEEDYKKDLESLNVYRVEVEDIGDKKDARVTISLSTLIVDYHQRKRLLAFSLNEGLEMVKSKGVKSVSVIVKENLLDEYRELDVIEVASKAINSFLKKSDIAVTLCVE